MLLYCNHKILCKESCWTISNITAGTIDQIKKVINAEIFPILIKLLYSKEIEIQKEAVWAITNATTCNDRDVVNYLVEQGCIEPLVILLDFPDPALTLTILEALQNILICGIDEENETNIFIGRLAACKGIEKIEELQGHKNINVYKKAIQILENFFDAEDVNESEVVDFI